MQNCQNRNHFEYRFGQWVGCLLKLDRLPMVETCKSNDRHQSARISSFTEQGWSKRMLESCSVWGNIAVERVRAHRLRHEPIDGTTIKITSVDDSPCIDACIDLRGDARPPKERKQPAPDNDSAASMWQNFGKRFKQPSATARGRGRGGGSASASVAEVGDDHHEPMPVATAIDGIYCDGHGDAALNVDDPEGALLDVLGVMSRTDEVASLVTRLSTGPRGAGHDPPHPLEEGADNIADSDSSEDGASDSEPETLFESSGEEDKKDSLLEDALKVNRDPADIAATFPTLLDLRTVSTWAPLLNCRSLIAGLKYRGVDIGFEEDKWIVHFNGEYIGRVWIVGENMCQAQCHCRDKAHWKKVPVKKPVPLGPTMAWKPCRLNLAHKPNIMSYMRNEARAVRWLLAGTAMSMEASEHSELARAEEELSRQENRGRQTRARSVNTPMSKTPRKCE